ncbi:TorF family putative porin [Paucibacter sp. Y2R2-4]|uniref:TorF family putative porin n=1 Tax=Paucibacter sp. Y2R2-4 TaxID=2893553 RepID=UPI0021E484E3|nr:TorF family putative porin [Paucibacter sp. Y2R2-4]MCV2351657.1 TorF family putative porin [Paucibacter sp. Y2R2-4]
MKKNISTLSLALAALFAGSVQAQDAAPAAAASPEHTLTGNLSLNSDYRFRGISQTWRLPALQGGFDYAHRSGFYAGTWASNVSGNSYNNGAGLELDLYGGFKFSLTQDLTLDLGALAYVYPGAKLNSAPGVASNKAYDNLDLYAGISAGAFSAKLSVAATDYFGLNSDTAGFAYFNSLAAKGSSKGSAYLDLNYNFDLGQGLTLGAHLGYLHVRNYGELSYTDAKLSISKEMLGLNWSAAVVGSNAKRDFYQAGNAAGQDAKQLGKTGLLVSVGKSF